MPDSVSVRVKSYEYNLFGWYTVTKVKNKYKFVSQEANLPATMVPVNRADQIEGFDAAHRRILNNENQEGGATRRRSRRGRSRRRSSRKH